MEGKLSKVAQSLKPSPIQELSHLAQRCGAFNLAEGFPDFPAPSPIKQAAISAINSDFNQYRHVQGICDRLAQLMKGKHGLDVDPHTDIAICCGQTEAFAATVFATINQGDEVLLFDPTYETYETCISLAGGIPVYVALDPPFWSLNPDSFMKSFTVRTKAVVLNSVTGWRIGWAIAPAVFASAIRNIHVKITDSAPAPFQEAALTALESPSEYFESLRADYEMKRDYILKMLVGVGFQIKFKPQGSFFIFAELPHNYQSSDVDFVAELIQKAGVTAVPGRGFFHVESNSTNLKDLSPSGSNYQKRYIRFAFCKSNSTLSAAVQKISSWMGKAFCSS